MKSNTMLNWQHFNWTIKTNAPDDSKGGGGDFQSYILKWEKKSANNEWLVELKIFLS